MAIVAWKLLSSCHLALSLERDLVFSNNFLTYTGFTISLGHEVIRGAMKDIEKALNDGDLKSAQATWKDLHSWEDIHKHMEEGTMDSNGSPITPIGMFALLDKECENVAQENNLRHQHTDLESPEIKLTKALNDPSSKKVTDSMKEAYAVFQKENLAHLEKEEKIMMPNVMKLTKAGKPMKKLMAEEIFPNCAKEDQEFFIKFANKTLQNHEDGMPRVRVFDHALWAISKPEEWKLWDQWIKEVLSDEKYNELQTAIQAWKASQAGTAAAENVSESKTATAGQVKSEGCCSIL